MPTAFITGLAGVRLTPDERTFLRSSTPAGLILFGRNIVDREQVRRLIGEARDAIGMEEALVLVDQEGGRVQRLRPPEWRALPSARQLGQMFEDDQDAPTDRDPDGAITMARLIARLNADDLRAVGFNTNCSPVLDLPVQGAHDIIGTRAYSRNQQVVIKLATATAAGQADGGVVSVGKHIPGHGRAKADTHFDLATVEIDRSELEATDFATFRALSALPAMMTAHVVYPAIDENQPASTSSAVHHEIIRGWCGFDGLLMSDDIGMQALEGPIGRRAERVLRAGSDVVLHCSGEFAEMEAVAEMCGRLQGDGRRRLEACAAYVKKVAPFDREAAEAACAEAFGIELRDQPLRGVV